MLLANAPVVLGEAGFVRPLDRSDDCPDGLRLIRSRLFNRRLVEKISVAWHDVPLLTPSERSPVTVRAARWPETNRMQTPRATGKEVATSAMRPSPQWDNASDQLRSKRSVQWWRPPAS